MSRQSPRLPVLKSPGEECFALHCKAEKINPQREFRFDPERKWRFDFAFPVQKIAVEIEGGIWKAGRHTRGSGYFRDCIKYNAAVIAGWRVLRYSTELVVSGQAIDDVCKLLREGA